MAIDAASPSGPDHLLVLRAMSDLAPSPAARDVLERALAAGTSIHVRDDEWMDERTSRTTLGAYFHRPNEISIRRSVLEDPRMAVQVLAHELYHAVDETSGRGDALEARLDAQYRAEGWTDAERSPQVKLHSRIATEARAHTFGVQVRRELGIRAWSSFERRLDEAPTELAAYQQAWAAQADHYGPSSGARLPDPPVVFAPGSSLDDPA